MNPDDLLESLRQEIANRDANIANLTDSITRLTSERDAAVGAGSGVQEPEVQQRINTATQDLQRQVSELTDQLRASEERRTAAEQNAANWQQRMADDEAAIRARLDGNGVGQEA